MGFLSEGIYFLLAAIIAVPICKRLGLGSVLGYMAAGIIIGPLVLGLIERDENIQHIGELGVVFLLYIIGLELKPSRLWTLRRSVFAVGGAQVLLTGAVLSFLAWLLGQAIGPGIVIGFALAMSSTAFALQMLSERNEMTTEHGRSAFGILLFQDLAVIPLLAIVPLLSFGVGANTVADVAEDMGVNPSVVDIVTTTVSDTVDDLAGEPVDLEGHGEVVPADTAVTLSDDKQLDIHDNPADSLAHNPAHPAHETSHAAARDAENDTGHDAAHGHASEESGENALRIAPIPQESLLWKIGEALLVILGVFVIGRYLLRYVLRAVAYTNNHELFTALSLLTVLGTALLMEYVGLSMALGGFLAGVLLADSEYRHQLESDIEPFKGLLLGLFFIATGMMLRIEPIIEQPVLMAALVVGLVGIKAAILYGVGRISGMRSGAALALAATLCQGGEFAFVIFIQAVAVGSLQQEVADLLIVVVTLSMVITPILIMLLSYWQKRREKAAEPEPDMPDMPYTPQVLIAGFGRFGQITARILAGHKIPFTALESSASQVDYVKQFGNKAFYGNPGRIELLRAAHAADAKVLVIAVDDIPTSLKIAEMARKHFPHLTVIGRARNRQHYYQLRELGVAIIRRETFGSALEVASNVLQNLGFSETDAENSVRMFRESDESRLEDAFADWTDDEKMRELARKAAAELQELFTQDAQAETSAGDEVEYPAETAQKAT